MGWVGVERVPTVSTRPVPLAASSTSKRVFDVVLSSVALLLLAVPVAVIGILIIIDSGWPPLFRQRRVGLDGRPFFCVKFRTMIQNAHELRGPLLERNEAPFPTFKIRFDPRTTRVGRMLRRTSLDEMPQFWNVLRGDMSIVGPRPPLPEEVAHYDADALRRLSVRPGITCFWQIEHRHEPGLTFQQWLAQDLRYIDTWTLALDIKLMLRTTLVVLRMRGS